MIPSVGGEIFKLFEHLGGRVSNNEVFSRDKNQSDVGQTF